MGGRCLCAHSWRLTTANARRAAHAGESRGKVTPLRLQVIEALPAGNRFHERLYAHLARVSQPKGAEQVPRGVFLFKFPLAGNLKLRLNSASKSAHSERSRTSLTIQSCSSCAVLRSRRRGSISILHMPEQSERRGARQRQALVRLQMLRDWSGKW